MKKTVLAACAALALIGMASCGSEEAGSGSGGSDDQQQSDQRHSEKDNGDDQSDDLGVGDTADLTGAEPGGKFEVTVAAVQDPSATVSEEPPDGTRYVGARFEVVNAGDTEVDYGSFDDGIELRTDDGRIYRPDDDLSGPAGDGKEPTTIAPEDTAEHWLVFLVDEGKEPEQLVLSSTSPFTDTEVQWDVD